jgi:hypothetical protein
MAKRADAVPINRVPWVAMGRKLKQLAVLPKDDNCQDSTEKAGAGRHGGRQEPDRRSCNGRARSRRRSSRAEEATRRASSTR